MRSFLFYSRVFVVCLLTGQWLRIWREAHLRMYGMAMSVRFHCTPRKPAAKVPFLVMQEAAVAVDSEDHLHPKGALNSLSHRGFLFAMEALLPYRPIEFLDLGCAGGGLVRDALKLGWAAAGVDGSGAAIQSWRGGLPLFGADITREFWFKERFDLMTAWEVLEHISEDRLPGLFDNVVRNLEPRGWFIASTNDETEIHEGVQLHVTRWSNAQWKRWIAEHVPALVEIHLPLQVHEYARQNFKNPSFLLYQKTS